MTTDAERWRRLLAAAAAKLNRPVTLMEVCGSHTVAIAKAGLRELLPDRVRLISGPGCPVCVSSSGFIAQTRELAARGVTVACFGDLLLIPGAHGARLGELANVEVLYSPEEALDYALAHPEREVVLAAVGFEPTLSATAGVLALAAEAGVKNFALLSDFKHLRPVLGRLTRAARLDGFLLPGHVATIVGEKGLAELGVPGVIAGFAPEAILHALLRLLEALAAGERQTGNDYPEAVRYEGACGAQRLIAEFFTVGDALWRGIGMVPDGGWRLREEWAHWDAVRRYDLKTMVIPEPAGCGCGRVLAGEMEPEACALFGTRCTPDAPVGPCMVSGEGACQAQYRYTGRRRVPGGAAAGGGNGSGGDKNE